MQEPETLARPVGGPPGIEIRAGKIPNNKQAGLLELSPGRIAAFDHTAAEISTQEIQIMATPKAAVNKDGFIQHEGLIVLVSDDGRIKVTAYAIDVLKNPWLIDRMRQKRRMGSVVGGIAVVAAGILELPEYEISDIDGKSGIVTARPRNTVYALQ